MLTCLIQSLLISIIAFVGVLVLIAFSNWRALRRLPSYAIGGHWPVVSILLPARNEEFTLQACMLSSLAQDCPDFEVTVLDDNSTDSTPRHLA